MGPMGGERARGAHLDWADPRYQREQARIVRRADFAVVQMGVAGIHVSELDPVATVENAESAGADRIAEQVPPVEPPVGAVIGVLGVALRRDHAEPAGVAVLALPDVMVTKSGPMGIRGNRTEHAAASDTYAL